MLWLKIKTQFTRILGEYCKKLCELRNSRLSKQMSIMSFSSMVRNAKSR